ncbi:FAD-dependent oxidoreductase [Mesorhizobium sp. M0208]|uniref:FAD-dependent oxidoreductase n=1 Tax=Mesorhizobium sp. M0208 TaxID=2956916 RepID=UPI00333C913F
MNCALQPPVPLLEGILKANLATSVFEGIAMTNTVRNRSVAVVGAGVTGIMTAYALAKRGVEGIVIDALPGPSEMCSRANAGIIAVGHAKAWAAPQAVGAMLKRFPGVIH